MSSAGNVHEELRKTFEEITRAKQRLAVLRKEAAQMDVGAYTFQTWDSGEVSLADLFGDRDDLLVVHNMGKSCPYCTLWADGFNGVTPHLENRAAFVVISPDDPAIQQEFAESRDWRFRMVSGAGNTFAKDMGYEHDGSPMPGVSGFRKHPDGRITRTDSSPLGPGDDYCAVWHLLELFQDGADGWEPKYTY
jgi:predicted dithiol-disulfide oxidoreductase (DUF899 family)